MPIIKVIPVSDPGNKLVAGAARPVKVVANPGNKLAGGRIIKVYEVSEGQRPLQGGDPIEVYQVDESAGLITPSPIYPVYVVEGAFFEEME